MSLRGEQIPVETVRGWIGSATTRFLGDTLGMSEAAWHGPSRLPGWTRAHVATHVARNADQIIAVLRDPNAASYNGHDSTALFLALERGADRPGVDLQLDVDTSASELDRVGRAVADWSRPIQFNGKTRPLATLLLLRLHEVCAHHLDLGLETGATIDDLDTDAGIWLLRFVLGCGAREYGEAMTINSSSGLTATLGSGRVRRKVSGTDASLWAWLIGRLDADSVEGARGLAFPPR